MRLIDADALIDWIRNDSGDKLMDSLYIDHINEMQTAYDVEEVVEQLGDFLEVTCELSEEVVKDAVEIVKVKQGSVGTDDACEWKQEDDNLITSCGDYFNILDNCTEKFDFCPKCGKKIKVVE